MCFFADTAFCLIIWVLARTLGNGIDEEHLMPVTGQIFGIFGHGCGHLSVATSGKDLEPITPYEAVKRDKEAYMHFASFAIVMLFWYGLLLFLK